MERVQGSNLETLPRYIKMVSVKAQVELKLRDSEGKQEDLLR